MRSTLRLAAACGSAALALGLAACGGSDPASPPATGAATTPVVVATTSAAPSRPSAQTLSHQAHFLLRSTTGYTTTVTISQGDLIRANAAPPPNGSATLGSGCSLEPAKSVALPFSVTLTNTTPGESNKSGVTLVPLRAARDYTTDSARLFMELAYTPGTPSTCVSVLAAAGPAGRPNITATEALAPDASLTIYGWLIANQYYTPNFPNGNPAALVNAVVQVAGAYDTQVVDSPDGLGLGAKAAGKYVTWGVAWNPANGQKSCLTTGGC